VGGGRAIVLHGPGNGGVHLFWLTKAGFTKAMFFDADDVPEHQLKTRRTEDGTETVVLLGSRERRAFEQEMLWWGM
jgi:hypothetical protein